MTEIEQIAKIVESDQELDTRDPKVIRKLERCIEEHYARYWLSTVNETVAKTHYPERHGAILSIDYSVTGSFLLTSHTTGYIEFRDGFRGDLIRQIQVSQMPATCARFHPTIDDFAMVSEEMGYVRCMRVMPSEIQEDQVFVKENYDIGAIEFSSDGSLIAVGGRSTRIRIYDVQTKKITGVFSLESNFFPPPQEPDRFHLSKVVSLSWSQQSPDTFVSGSWDNTIRLWDKRVPKGAVMMIQGPNICGDCVDIHGNRVLVGAWQLKNGLSIWDLQSGREIRNVDIIDRTSDTGEDFLYTAKFWRSEHNPNGRYAICGGSGTKQVEALDVVTGRLMYSWPQLGTVTSATSRGARVAWAGSHPAVFVSEFHSPMEFVTPEPIEEEGVEEEYEREEEEMEED